MAKESLKVTVECYSGHKGEESPRRFYLGKMRVEVSEILDRWLAPDHRYFKISGDNNAIYILRHDTKTGDWEMTMYDSGKSENTRLSAT